MVVVAPVRAADAPAAKFWPLYDRFQEEQCVIIDGQMHDLHVKWLESSCLRGPPSCADPV